MTTTAEIWAAVNRLTLPQQVQISREVATLFELDDVPSQYGECNVASYRAATVKAGRVPSLWQQATNALTGGEVGGTGSKPLRERSPADLDLMEIRAIIRDTTRHELHTLRGSAARGEFDPGEIRALARVVIDADEDLWWWGYRFEQWCRLLETYLHLSEHRAKPVRLRNTACPRCQISQVVTAEEDDEPRVVPALIVDFSPDGYVRAAECLHCGAAWFRGEQLEQLAREVSAQSERIGA